MTIDARVELYYDGAWNDITPDVAMEAGDITVKYGQPDEHSESVPTSVGLVLDNRDRSYSPKDPMSPLYGLVDRNTPMRVRIGDPQPALALPGANGSYASTPDAAALDITGDIDIRMDLTPETWHPAATTLLAGKWNLTGDNIAWAVHLTSSGNPELSWSTNGTLAARIVVPATDVVYDQNLCPNPAGGLDVDDWTTNKTLTRVTGLLDSGFERDTGGRITGDGSGEDFVIPAPADAVAGRVYSGAATLMVSADATVEVYLLFLNSGLSVLASPSTGEVAVGAGAAVRLSVEGETAPANTAHIAMQISLVNSTADLTVSCCRMQRGPTADDYGDGFDIGWEWSGAEHESTSRHVRGVRRAVRATLDVNNGASGRTTTFYIADTIDGSWTQLGTAVTTAGTTSIDAGNADLTIGARHGGGLTFSNIELLRGLVHAFELRDGIGGSVVADPDFTSLEPGTTSVTDTAGRAWTINGHGHITDPSLRASVAIASWVPTWDETTLDAQTVVDAAGVLRRLGQGSAAVSSALKAGLLSLSTVVAYWPCEDQDGSTTIASALPGARPMQIHRSSPDFAANSDFACSDPLPLLQESYWVGIVPPHTLADRQQIRFPLSVPASGIGNDSTIATLITTGTIRTWAMRVSDTGALKLVAFAANGTQLHDTGYVAFAVNGSPRWVSIEYEQVGAHVECNLVTLEPGAGTGLQLPGGGATINSHTLGVTLGVQINALGDVAVGHISVHNVWSSLFDLGDQLAAWDGETAGARIGRLCDEAGIPLVMAGDPSQTVPMGIQRSGTLTDHLTACQTADLGILGETRDRRGLRYLPRVKQYNRVPVLDLDMSLGTITNPFAPPLDDQDVRNDITVTREGGSSYRAVQETGPVNVQDPEDDPQGVGRHTSSVTLNLRSDAQLPDQAGWRLHLGTQDGHRVSVLEIEMEHHPELVQTVLGLQQGDVIRLTDTPPGLPPGALGLVVLGWSEQIGTQTWRLSINLAPADPWTVAVLDSQEQRLDSASSTLAGAVTTTADSFTVTTSNPKDLWTTDPGQMPVLVTIEGEDMSVGAITGTTSPQTFSDVVRSLNGVVKGHSAGDEVHVTHPIILEL